MADPGKSILQWKDAKAHFASTKNCLLKHAQQIDLREKQVLEMKELIEGRRKEAEIKWKRVDECWNEIPVKKEELKVLKALSLECDLELGSKRKELTLVQADVMESREKLRLVKGQLALVQKDLQECHKKISVRKQELGMVEKSVTQVSGELELKEMELNTIGVSVEERRDELTVKDSELKSVLLSLEECSKELKILNEQKTSVRASILECSMELESKERSLASAKKTLKECSEKVHVRQQQLTEVCGELELKEKELSLCKTSLEECCNKFQVKETQLGLIKKSIEEHSAKLSAEEEKLDSVLKSKEEELHKICGDIELKETEFNTIGTSIEERRDELIVKDSELKSVVQAIEECSKELRILNEQKTSIQTSIPECTGKLESEKSLRECCEELASKVARLEAIQATYGELGKKPIEKEKCFDSLEKTIEVCLDGFGMREMQFEEQMKECDSKEQQILAMQRSMEEKCKEAVEEDCGSFIASSQLKDSLVNNAIDFFHSDSMTSDQNFQSEVNKYVTKTDLGNDEVLPFLHLSEDPANFVLNVLQGSCKNEVIGLTAKDMSKHVRLLENLMKVSPKITPQVKEQARKLALVWKSTTELEMKNSDDVLAFLLLVGVYELASCFREEFLRFSEAVIQQKQAPEICRALGFASMIPDFIKNLMAKKQYIAAARFSCEFGLGDNFPPLELFKKYLANAIMDAAHVSESSRESSCEAKVIDKEIAALRSILECISEYKLNCNVVNITNRISELVKEKAEKRCSLQTSNPADEAPQDSKMYPSLSTPVTGGRSTQKKRKNFRDELQGENGNKLRRVDRASGKPSFS